MAPPQLWGGLLTSQRAEAQTAPSHGVYSVRAYGAVGDGQADDTAAVRAAITAVWTYGGVAYFPAGRYRVTQKLVFNNAVGVNTPNIALIGDGRGVSNVEFTSMATGMELSFASADRQLHVSGLSLKAACANAGVALFVRWPHDFGPYSHAYIEDVEFCPVDLANHYWHGGLCLSGGGLSTIRSVWFRGKSGTRDSAYAIELTNCNQVLISGCQTNFSDVAINIDGGTRWGDVAGCEGINIRDCNMVHHNIGVRSLSGIGEGLPVVEVSSSHIFSFYRGIQVRNRNQVTFAHNTIYQGDTSHHFVAIECQDNCGGASIHDNRFVRRENSPSFVGIVHSGAFSQVNHNVSSVASCVILRNQSRNCLALGNMAQVGGAAVWDELRGAGDYANTVSMSKPY